MNKTINSMVDDYEKFLLNRYSLGNMSRQKAGRILKRLQDPWLGRDQMFWSVLPVTKNIPHNLETLRFNLTLITPTVLNCGGERPDLPICGGTYKDWDIGKNLPFPPERVVEKITGRDLVFLKRTFGLSGDDRYARWIATYGEINKRFEGKRSEANQIIKWLDKNLAPNVPIAPIFLASARAFLIDQRTKDTIENIKKEKRIIQGFKEEAAKYQEAIDLILDAVVGDHPDDPRSLKQTFGDSLRKTTLGVTLPKILMSKSKEFKKQIRINQNAGILRISPYEELTLGDAIGLFSAHLQEVLESRSEGHKLWIEDELNRTPRNLQDKARPEEIYRALNGVSQLIKKCGLKSGFKKMALEFFSLWEIKINGPTFGMWKSRR